MPPPADHPCLNLHVLPGLFFVVQLGPSDSIPTEVLEAISKGHDMFLSVTRTREELSIVGASNEVYPTNFQTESTWRCIQIEGPMAFELVGVVASFVAPLKAIECPVFVTSTWNTDYIMVPGAKLSAAVDALKSDGWKIASHSP